MSNLSETVSALAAGAASGVALLQAQTEGQSWSILGLLAVLMLGVGKAMVRAIEKGSDATTTAIKENTAQQAATQTKLELVLSQVAEMRRDGEQKRQQILASLSDLPDQVADRVRKPA